MKRLRFLAVAGLSVASLGAAVPERVGAADNQPQFEKQKKAIQSNLKGRKAEGTRKNKNEKFLDRIQKGIHGEIEKGSTPGSVR